MKTQSDPFHFAVKGFGDVGWGTQFDQVGNLIPTTVISTWEENRLTAQDEFDLCPQRTASIRTTGLIFDEEAIITLNFNRGRLCSKVYNLPRVWAMEPEQFYALIDAVKRRLTGLLGEPKFDHKADVSGEQLLRFRWESDSLNAEVCAREGEVNLFQLAAVDPEKCNFCVSLT